MADLRAALTDIYQKNGELTPEIVVEEARPKASPLHHRFEWDDSAAADAFRRVQAQELIRSVRVIFDIGPKGERKSIRAFHSLKEAGDSERTGYVPTEELVQDELATKILLKQCEREIVDLKRKYGHLNEFAQIIRTAAEGVA